MTSTAANPLPFSTRDLAQAPAAERIAVTAAAPAIVCRTVTVRAAGSQLQAELERELRALLGLNNRRRRN